MAGRLVSLVAGLVVALAACAQPADLVFANRSDVPIALGPGITIAACSTASFSRAELDASSAKVMAAAGNGDGWTPPAGTVYLDQGIVAPIGAPKPMTLIVSGTAKPRIVYGPVPDSDLPACGGQPNLSHY